MDAPQFTHDSTCCRFLGRSTDGECDLYVCEEVGTTYLARCGNDGPEYYSVAAIILNELVARHPESALYLVQARDLASGPAVVAHLRRQLAAMQSLCNTASVWQASYASDRLDNEYFQENDAIEAKLAEAVLAYREQREKAK